MCQRFFRAALKKLNPWITLAQIDEAQKKSESHLSTASLLQINEEKYAMINDGIPLLFVELKKNTVDVQNAYDDNYTDYLDTIP